jgi:hypothetical protein
MKTIEEIQKEYKIYELEEDTNIITSFEEFMLYVGSGLNELLKQNKILKRQKIKLTCEEFVGNIINFLSLTDTETYKEFCEEDISIISEATELSYTCADDFAEIIMVAHQENYQELLKLTCFIAKYYVEHINYLNEKRNSLVYYSQGINYYNGKYEDNRKVFEEFVKMKINEFTKSETVEKVKKI